MHPWYALDVRGLGVVNFTQGMIDLIHLAGLVAPIATAIAALMTAANLGTRFTGWGFVVFTIGSLAWIAVGLETGQANLLWTNALLTIVNLVGVWRWLGRQVRHENGSEAAKARSAAANVPNLFGMKSLIGAALLGKDGAAIGTIIDAMMRCDAAGLAYLVVSEGGVGGAGERLHALPPHSLRFAETVTCDLDAAQLARLRIVPADNWPAALASSVATR